MGERVPYDLQTYPFDIIVVGAGINGAGIARDASMRGLRVLLLDKGDISDGTTSWSTRLIHGGLRYLEYYEFSLVRESLAEREKLLHIAPHLVKPLPFLVPIYETSKRGPALIRAGMLLYDTLSFDKSMPRHRMLSRAKTLEMEPGVNPEGLKAAALYYDGQVEYAERLAVENAISAREHGALVLTYARVERLITEGPDRVTGVEFTDLLEGGTHTAYAPLTINVAGPWVDRVLGELGHKAGRMIGGTKGTHLVVDPFPGAPQEALYVEARRDGRPYFIVPWNGRYLIGTTDFRYEGDLDYVSATDDEIEYLIDETNYVIPRANLTTSDVLFTYSGVRPLPYVAEGSESSITRSHIVHDHAREDAIEGLISIVGGKLTTYRNLARQTTDMAYHKLHLPTPPCRTDRIPLPGGTTHDFAAFCARFKTQSGLPDELAQRLLDLYGTRASRVLKEAGDDPSLRMPLAANPTRENALIGAEILYAFRHEMATTLADALLRRTMAALGPRVALDLDEAAAEVAARYLGWSSERTQRELTAFRDYVRRFRPASLQKI